MSELSLREQHIEKHRRQAAKAFAQHVITKRSDRRWLIQGLHEDGKPDWTFAAEIIVLEGGALYVGGDIDHCVFSSGPRDPLARLRWMGECTDLGYYVRQKARIGMARYQDCVDIWIDDIAHEELRLYLTDVEVDGPGFSESDRFDCEAFERARRTDERHVFLESACDAFKHDYDICHSVSGMGQVLSPAVIYAHAALARLCVMLREEERAVEGKEATCAR